MSGEGSNIDALLEQLEKEGVPLHRFAERVGSKNLAVLLRRRFLERKLGISLSSIGSTIIDFEEVEGRNIENAIGATQVPLAVVGPLRVLGEYARGEFYVPMATTEGALVAGVNRGAKAITLSGGARCRIVRDGMTRAPLFRLPSIEEAIKFVSWVEEHFDEIKRAAESTTRFGKLVRVEPYVMGNLVWLRFVYTTGDAMGMNMATIATDAACRYILENYPGSATLVALSGNMCVDKKPAHINALLGRGKTVVAEAVIPRDVLEKVFRVGAEEVHRVNVEKNLLGSAYAGSLSFNAHFANIIAAIFIATGQDVAQVVESSMGWTVTEVRGDALYISVTLPSLEVGTVGGGTRLPTQREALEIMGVAGSGNPPGTNARKFAEIVAATVLAGELNLLAALARNELASAHARARRGELVASKRG